MHLHILVGAGAGVHHNLVGVGVEVHHSLVGAVGVEVHHSLVGAVGVGVHHSLEGVGVHHSLEGVEGLVLGILHVQVGTGEVLHLRLGVEVGIHHLLVWVGQAHPQTQVVGMKGMTEMEKTVIDHHPQLSLLALPSPHYWCSLPLEGMHHGQGVETPRLLSWSYQPHLALRSPFPPSCHSQVSGCWPCPPPGQHWTPHSLCAERLGGIQNWGWGWGCCGQTGRQRTSVVKQTNYRIP